MPYTHILAPTDLSATANVALSCAFEEAKTHQAKLTLLHVMTHHQPTTEVYYINGLSQNDMAYISASSGCTLPAMHTSLSAMVRRDYCEETLTQLRDLAQGSFTGPWEVEIASGNPADAIVSIAHKHHTDLIVMGTHGRTGLQHVLLGSVAEKVVRLAPCPVLTIKGS
jgi:nucleotide-binding universal stress UspA family protein